MSFPELDALALNDAIPIAGGSFGTVYRAFDARAGRLVAVKVLDRSTGNPDDVFAEAQAAAAARHPNIVSIYDSGVLSDGRPYLVMELAAGTLQERAGSLGVYETLRYTVKLASALAELHALGIVHGDIKPENILFTENGEPLLSDFGAAVVPSDAELQALTVHFASPEALAGYAVSDKSDVFSLAATMLAAVVPRTPGADVGERAHAVRLKQWDAPVEVKEQFLRAVATDPRERPSARELATALAGCQQSLGLSRSDDVLHRPTVVRVARTALDLPQPRLDASHTTMYRAARRFEDRRARAYSTRAVAAISLGVLGALLPDLVLRVAESSANTKALFGSALLLVALSAVVVLLLTRILIWIRRRRERSMTRRALELAARMRTAYISEIRALRDGTAWPRP